MADELANEIITKIKAHAEPDGEEITTNTELTALGIHSMSYIELMRFLLAALILSLALVACDRASREQFDGEVDEPSLQSSTSDQWITIEGVDFPVEMKFAPDEVKEAYVFAAKHPEILQYMPCYCGCGGDQHQHRSNYDCFVDQIDRSGERPRVDVDQMGFG